MGQSGVWEASLTPLRVSRAASAVAAPLEAGTASSCPVGLRPQHRADHFLRTASTCADHFQGHDIRFCFEDAASRLRLYLREAELWEQAAAEVTPLAVIGPWNFQVGEATLQMAQDYSDLVHGRITGVVPVLSTQD